MADDPATKRPPTLDEFEAQARDEIRQVIRVALDDVGYERPRALLLQIEADIQGDCDDALCDIRRDEQQATFDSFNRYEQDWFRAHQTWEGEIVTTQEFIRRLKVEPKPTSKPAPEPPPFHLTREPATTDRPRQMDLF